MISCARSTPLAAMRASTEAVGRARLSAASSADSPSRACSRGLYTPLSGRADGHGDLDVLRVTLERWEDEGLHALPEALTERAGSHLRVAEGRAGDDPGAADGGAQDELAQLERRVAFERDVHAAPQAGLDL